MGKSFNYEDGYKFLRDFLELGGLDIAKAFENLNEVDEDYYYIIDAIQEYASCCDEEERVNLKRIDLNSFLYERVLQDASEELIGLLKDNYFDLRDYIYVHDNYLATCYDTRYTELLKEKIKKIDFLPDEFPKKLKFVLSGIVF